MGTGRAIRVEVNEGVKMGEAVIPIVQLEFEKELSTALDEIGRRSRISALKM